MTQPEQPLALGIVGCGEMGRIHGSCLMRIRAVRMVAVCDRDGMRAERLAGELGVRPARAYRNVAEMLAELASVGGLDAVYVCTRHDSHAEIARMCLGAGLDVFCEKPLAMTLRDAAMVLEAVARSGRRLMVGFNHRFTPPMRRAREFIQKRAAAGRPPRVLNIHMGCSNFLEGWPGRAGEGGGVVHCLGSHAFDMACYLAGDRPAEVTCRTARLRLAGAYLEDTAAAILLMRGGAVATVTFHDHSPSDWATEPGFNLLRAEAVGEGWALAAWGLKRVVFLDERDGLTPAEGAPRAEETPYEPAESWGYAEEDRRFIAHLRDGTRPVPCEGDGYLAVSMVESALLSASSGSAVRVEGLGETGGEGGESRDGGEAGG